MAVAKRIFLFLTVNFLVVMMISFIMRILNVSPYLTQHGLNFTALLIFCFIWGSVGAFISLLLSKYMAKWMMKVQIISPNTTNETEKQLLQMVEKLAKDANIPMPEVGVYNSPEINAFATGATKRNSLVAVSSGLVNRFKTNEINAILGHEVSHIANGDMVTMTLLQGIVNAFVMFLARVLAHVLTSRGNGRQRSFMAYYALVIVFEILFMILGSIVVATFSRFREYRADLGGAYLAGKDSMIGALESLKATQNIVDESKDSPSFQAFKISTSKRSWMQVFASHPPLDKRIERLKNLSI